MTIPIDIDPQRYMLIIGYQDGDCHQGRNYTFEAVIATMQSLRRYSTVHSFHIQPEAETPIPDSVLVPNAQPVAEGQAQG